MHENDLELTILRLPLPPEHCGYRRDMPTWLVCFFKQIPIPPARECLGTETSELLRRGNIIPPWVTQPRMGEVRFRCALRLLVFPSPGSNRRLLSAQSTNHTQQSSLNCYLPVCPRTPSQARFCVSKSPSPAAPTVPASFCVNLGSAQDASQRHTEGSPLRR